MVDLADEGFPLVGGRVDVIGRVPVPTLVYRHRAHLISLYAVPAGRDAIMAAAIRVIAPHLRGQIDRVVFDAAFEGVDVAPRAEGIAGAGNDQRPQRCLIGKPGEGGPELDDHLGAHRIEALGTIEGEGADLSVDLDLQRAQLGRADRLGGHLAISVSIWKVGQLARSLPFGL